VADLPVETAPAWEQLKKNLPRRTPTRPVREPTRRPTPWPWLAGWRPGAQALGWATAVQFALLLVLGGVLVLRPVQPAQPLAPAYQTLGAAPAPAAGNLIVIFRPDTPEKALRGILNASRARLVDGPTAADAYVLHVAPGERAAVLISLRARREVVLAEPIDAAASNAGKP